MTHCVALIRGINVGKAKRIAMADLRSIVAGLGHAGVRTLLNSGNVVFGCDGDDTRATAQAIHAAIAAQTGISAQVVVVTARDLARTVRGNPFPEAVHEPSRYLVAFVSDPCELQRIASLATDSWVPDQLALGKQVAYIWCAGGILESRLAVSVMKAMGETATTRNWATVMKLHALASAA